MKKLLLLLAVTLVGLTSCEERLDRLDEVNLQQNIQIDILRTDLNALTQSVNDEIARVEQIIAAVDAENDAALIEGLSAAQAELQAAVALLAQADTDNLVAALAAVSAAEETLAMVIANNLAATTAALEALGVVDADLLSRIETILSDIAALDAALSAEDVRLDNAIALANTLIDDANEAIQTNADAIAELEALVAGIRNTIDNIWTSIQNAHTVNDNQRELIQGLHDAIDKIKDVNNGQKDALADLYKKVKVLQNVVALGEGGNATQAELDAAIAAVEAALAVLEGDVAANTAAIAEVKSALASVTADLQSQIDAIDFTDAQELADAIQAALDAAKEYADANDSDTVFDDTALLAAIELINTTIGTNSATWSLDTTLDATAITQEIADAIANIPGFDDSAIQDALTSLQNKLDELVGDVADLSDVAKQQIALMELDGFTKVEGEIRTWSKSTSKGLRVVYVDTEGLLFPSVVLFGETYSLGGRTTFAGVLDAFLKFNIERYDDIKADYDAAQAETETSTDTSTETSTEPSKSDIVFGETFAINSVSDATIITGATFVATEDKDYLWNEGETWTIAIVNTPNGYTAYYLRLRSNGEWALENRPSGVGEDFDTFDEALDDLISVVVLDALLGN